MAMTGALFAETERCVLPEFKTGLLKWVGSKQKTAHVIASHFPKQFGTFFEPFLGGGAVLGTIAPSSAVASDVFEPLIQIWQMLAADPEVLKGWYADRWERFSHGDANSRYRTIRDSYNANPNGPDLLFLCRSCYGGIVRFRKLDGFMSTPCGIHKPMRPETFERRVDEWAERTAGTSFHRLNYLDAMHLAKAGDLIYCDPPYVDSQTILYGAQSFSFPDLLDAIKDCKRRGVFVALSIDGTKKSGATKVTLPIPPNLFEQEIVIDCGTSMLRRFQVGGEQMNGEGVTDRLLLTYPNDDQ
jgi:DNA adenine methylase